MSVAPISPKDALSVKSASIPEFVIEAVNELISEKGKKYSSKFEATILQKDIITRIQLKEEITSKTIYDNNWLDIEDIFREAGWKVTYDKPAYNESYDAYFKFEGKL